MYISLVYFSKYTEQHSIVRIIDNILKPIALYGHNDSVHIKHITITCDNVLDKLSLCLCRLNLYFNKIYIIEIISSLSRYVYMCFIHYMNNYILPRPSFSLSVNMYI